MSGSLSADMGVRQPKIVMIGAGSTVFTPGLIGDLVSSSRLHDASVILVDLDPLAVDVMVRLARRIAGERGVNLRVEGTTDRREALPGATFVTVTIAVGGAEAWGHDVAIPERYGICQTVGDSVGPGGVFRALRHVPELAAIARDMEDLCRDAWLFNYCNPLSVNVRAVHKSSSIKCIGLCHGILGTRRTVARYLGLPAAELNIVAAGINHLCWLLEMRHRDHDVYPAFREKVREEQEGLRAGTLPPGIDPYEGPQQVSALLMDIYGLYPSPGDRHVAEFYPFFLRKEEDELAWGLQSGLDMTNDFISGKGTLLGQLKSQAEGSTPLDQYLLEKTREGERVVGIMESILFDLDTRELAVNVRNEGLLSNMPPWAIVEVPGTVNGQGIHGVPVGNLPHAIENTLRSRIYQQELTVNAALTGDRELALQALLADPLVRDVESARAMLEDALNVHGTHLPQFARDPVYVPVP